jgi:large subunit ribosomal protein L10
MVASPLTGLVRGLGSLLSGLAIALGQVQEKKAAEGPPEEPAAEETPESPEASEESEPASEESEPAEEPAEEEKEAE